MIQSIKLYKSQNAETPYNTSYLSKKDKTENKKSANMDLMANLEAKSTLNRMGIMNKNFEFGLDSKELEKRTQKDYLSKITLLKEDSKEFENLAEGDKKALKHLVKAANILNDVYLKQDNPKNIEFRDYLKTESTKGNNDAKNALILFDAQKGMSAIDRQSQMVNLLKGSSPKEGKALYPQDLSTDELHKILIKMLEEGNIDEVKKILSQRSVVKRNGDKLKAVDYTEEYSKEFKSAADELEKAAEVSTDKDFNELLKFVEENYFEKIGVFIYSKEDGTPAAKLKEQIHHNTKKKRYNIIMNVAKTLSSKNLEKYIGNTYEVLIENLTFDNKYYIGRSFMDIPETDGTIIIKNTKSHLIRELCTMQDNRI